MLKIEKSIIEEINNASNADDLFKFLQAAIKLEHSTIPPYLAALFSISQDDEDFISEILRSIVQEEMLHMTIVANILNSIGGHPQFNDKNFIPQYPGQLPMIKDGPNVGLKKLTLNLVKEVFMKIESPEQIIEIPVSEEALYFSNSEFATIGEFYKAIQRKIANLSKDNLPGNPALQVLVSGHYTQNELFPIITKEDAIRAINVIIEQGEGTDKSPNEPFNNSVPAHYYRFEQIVKRKKLTKDSNGAPVFSGVVNIDELTILPLWDNTKLLDLSNYPSEQGLLKKFNTTYSGMLDNLQICFNGNPDKINDAIKGMRQLALNASELCNTDFPGKLGYKIGPSFEYVN